MPQKIKEKYGTSSVGRIDSFINHNEGDLSLFKTLGKKYYYSKKLLVYNQNNQEYFKKQASIFKRYKLFFSDPKKLFKDPILGLGLLFMKTTEFCVGGYGYSISKFFWIVIIVSIN